MAKPYRECPVCGKRALSIATRCPGCGHEFLMDPARRQSSRDTGPLRALAVLAMVLVVVGGIVTLVVRRNVARDREERVTAAVRTESPIALDTAQAAASPLMADSAPGAGTGAGPRYARTWTKVHDRRSVKADVVAVLLPGDTVLADSLRRGWWRVALEGRVIGYVYARTLAGN